MSKTLQSTLMSAAEGARIATMTEKTLQSIHSDEHYDAFWDLSSRLSKKWMVMTHSCHGREKFLGDLKKAVL